MTGFGWDPTHSIVKARQDGLQTVLYKPFRADRLMEAVEQALRTQSGGPCGCDYTGGDCIIGDCSGGIGRCTCCSDERPSAAARNSHPPDAGATGAALDEGNRRLSAPRGDAP